MQYPKQAANVYVEQLEGELCVYDWEKKQMHALNPTAALVWQQCDGQTDPAQMAARLESKLNVPNADKLVALSLNRLGKARLLEGGIPQAQRPITRREVLKMAGIGMALLPVVSSIVLPTPAQAQTCVPNCAFPVEDEVIDDCEVACRAELFSFETLCSTERVGVGQCRCNVYTTDLEESGCGTELESLQNRR